MPKRHRAILVALAMIIIAALATMLLWNAVMPAIFTLPPIHYGQALALMILARLLIGSLGGIGDLTHALASRHALKDHWRSLSPEERTRLLERHGPGFGRHCRGPFGRGRGHGPWGERDEGGPFGGHGQGQRDGGGPFGRHGRGERDEGGRAPGDHHDDHVGKAEGRTDPGREDSGDNRRDG
jgi:hypothetical protein